MPPIVRPTTAAVLAALAVAAPAAAAPASPPQDFRAPDRQAAATPAGVDLRSPDVRDVASGSVTVVPQSPGSASSGDLEPLPLAVGGATLLLTGIGWSVARRRRRVRQALAGTSS